jgi:hypothetical protein
MDQPIISRPSNNKYREEFNRIFPNNKFEKIYENNDDQKEESNE